jgi:hypothetical protein
MLRILLWGSIWIDPCGTSHARFPPIVPPPQSVPVAVHPPAVCDDFMGRLPDIHRINQMHTQDTFGLVNGYDVNSSKACAYGIICIHAAGADECRSVHMAPALRSWHILPPSDAELSKEEEMTVRHLLSWLSSTRRWSQGHVLTQSWYRFLYTLSRRQAISTTNTYT